MVRLPHLVVIGAVAAMAFSASAQQRTSPPRLPGGGIPPGSYQQTCRGISLNGNLLRAQCTNERGAPVSSTLDTNSCRGSDIRNDNGYLRCGSTGGGGPRPPVPPAPGPRPPEPPRPEPPRPPSGGAFEVIAYTRANYSGQQLRIRQPIDNLANYRGFNDNIRSIRVIRGRVQICEDARYRGRCTTISRSTGDLNRVGMANRVSSIR